MKEHKQTKPRSDSLYSRCTPEQRAELLVFLVELGGPYSEALKMLERWGVRASLGSLHNFISRNTLAWRMDRAAEIAASEEGKLPADWEESRRKALAQKAYELAFRDLTIAEFVALERLDLDKRTAKTKATLENRKLSIAERRVVLQEASSRAAAAVNEAGKRLAVTPDVLKEILEAVDKKILGID